MTTNPQINRYAQELARDIATLKTKVRHLENKPQLHRSSIHDGSIDEYSGKDLASVIGRQFDGGHGVVPILDPKPPQPSQAIAEADQFGTISMRWDGTFTNVDGVRDLAIVAPTYWSRVECHLSQDPLFTAEFADTLIDSVETPRGGTISAKKEPGTWYARLVSRSKSGKRSVASPPVTITLSAPPDLNAELAEIQAEADAAVAAANDAQAAAATSQQEAIAARSAADQALLDAQAAAAAADAAEIDANASAADVATAQQAAADSHAAAVDALARAEAAETSASTATGEAAAAEAAADAAATDAAAALSRAVAAEGDADAAQAAANDAQAAADAAAISAANADTDAASADAAAAQAAADAAQAVADAAKALEQAEATESSAAKIWYEQPPDGAVYNWTGTAYQSDSIKTVDGIETRRNDVTNPSFDAALSGWGANSADITVEQDATTGRSRLGSAKATINVAVVGDFNNFTSRPAALPGDIWTASAYVKSGVEQELRLTIEYRDAANVRLDSSISTYMAPAGGDFTRMQVTMEAPVNTASVFMRIGVNGSAPAGTVWWGDDAMLEKVGVAGPYFDGGTPDDRASDLWIDTSLNAQGEPKNTPKRWNGSGWTVATDQVALDAASTANSALSASQQAELDADAAAADAQASLDNAIAAGNDAAAAQQAATDAQTAADASAAAAAQADTAAANADASAAQAAADAAQAVADAAAAAQSASDAQAAATQAATDAGLAAESASQTSHIFWTVNEPVWSGDPDTANWFQQQTTSGPTIAWWRWDGTDFVKMDVGEAFLPQVNIGTGTFGSLSGDRVSLRSLTTRHLKLHDWQNLLPSPAVDPEAWTLTNGASIVVDATAPEGVRFNFPNNATAQPAATGPYITVLPGDSIYLEANTSITGSGAVPMEFFWQGYDSLENFVTDGVITAESTPGGRLTGQFEVPANIIQIKLTIRTAISAATGSRGAFSVVGRRLIKGSNSRGTTLIGPEGIQTFTINGSLATQLGIFGDDYLGISNLEGETVAAITSEGKGLFTGLSVDLDPEVGGMPLLGEFANHSPVSVKAPVGHLDIVGRGVVVNAERDVRGDTVSNGERELLEFQFTEVAGRAYRLTMEPLGMYVDDNTYGQFRFRYEYGNVRPTMDSPIWRMAPARPVGQSGMQLFGGTWIHQPALTTATRTMRVLVTMISNGGRSTVYDIGESVLRTYVEDIGMRVEDTAVIRNNVIAVGSTSPAPQPTEPTRENITKKFVAQNVQTYINSGAKYILSGASSRLYQGNSGFNTQNGSSTGNLRSMATFADWTGELSGAEITEVEVYLYFPYWYNSAGGTAEIGLHGYDVIQNTFTGNSTTVLRTHFDKPEGRWVTLPSQYYDGFKTGQWKGLWLGPGSYRDDHGYARDGAAFRFHYKK